MLQPLATIALVVEYRLLERDLGMGVHSGMLNRVDNE